MNNDVSVITSQHTPEKPDDYRFPMYDAATGQMCFSSALLCLKRGFSIQRTSWAAEGVVRVIRLTDSSGRPIFYEKLKHITPEFGDTEVPYRPTHGDLAACDWIQVVDTAT